MTENQPVTAARLPSSGTTAAPYDRFGIVWHSKRWILAVTIAITVMTFVISSVIPATYSSSANILVSAVAPGGLTKDAVDGTNDLASQYAQLVKSDDVIGPAAHALGVSSSSLGTSISAGTVAAQNIVAVTATASSAQAAQRRANAVAGEFVVQQQRRNFKLASTYTSLASASQTQFESAVARTITQLSSASSTTRSAAAGALSVLLSERQQQLASNAQASANTQPLLSVNQAAGLGSKVVPRPTLYAGLALVISFVITAQLAGLIGVRNADRSALSNTRGVTATG